jgi:hypothetical protein
VGGCGLLVSFLTLPLLQQGMSTYPMVAALKSELNSLRQAFGFCHMTGRLFGQRAILLQLSLNQGQLCCWYVLLTGRSNPFCGMLYLL